MKDHIYGGREIVTGEDGKLYWQVDGVNMYELCASDLDLFMEVVHLRNELSKYQDAVKGTGAELKAMLDGFGR